MREEHDVNEHPTLVDVLNPKYFPDHPIRTKVTRIVLQAEEDRFELAEREKESTQRRDRRIAS
jgi:hypothetical protein